MCPTAAAAVGCTIRLQGCDLEWVGYMQNMVHSLKFIKKLQIELNV